MSFDYFSTSYVIEVLRFLFYVTMPFGLSICLISNSTEVENIPWVNRHFKNEQGFVNRSVLLTFRLALCYLMMFPTFLIKDEFLLMVLSGLVATPVIGFVLPV